MKKFQVFITEENGNTLHVDNGVVMSNAARKPLPNNPDGWQDISIGWERNMSKYGVVRNFSLALGFVLASAKILRSVFFTENIERKLSLLVTMLSLELNTTFFAFNYNFLYKGDLDFSTFQSEGPKVTMNIMEGGISKLLKANEATIYEFPLDDPDALDLYCDGIYLFQRVNYALTDGLTYEATANAIDMPILSTEGLSAEVVNTAQTFDVIGIPSLNTYRHTSSNYFIKNTGTTTVLSRVKGKIFLRCNSISWNFGATSHKVYLRVVSSTDPMVGGSFFIENPNVGETYTIDLDINCDMFGIVDQAFFFIFQAGDTATDAANISFEFMPGSVVSSEFSSRFKASIVKIFTLETLYKKWGAKIFGTSDAVISQLLAANRNICVTCGDAIRGFTTAKIRTNGNDLFDSANVQFNAGMGIEGNKLTLEEKAHYFGYSNPIPLGEVKSLKVYYAADLVANTFRIGSAPQDYNDINGRQEFNNETLYGSPITRVVKEFNLSSPYRRDCYGFEFTRINFEGKLTTDSDSDNDVWLVNVELGSSGEYHILFFGLVFETVPNIIKIPVENVAIGPKIIISDSTLNNGTYTVVNVSHITGFTNVTVLEALINNTGSGNLYTNEGRYILKRGVYDSITGLLSPESVFNLEDMTNARLMEIHANWIHAMMWGFDNDKLPFLTTDKNRELKTVQGLKIYDEDADIIIKDLAPPLFIPIYFEVETKVPVSLPSLLENNPAKCFSFIWEGDLYKGFLMKAGISISDNATQVFKLLSTPDNDLSKLIV